MLIITGGGAGSSESNDGKNFTTLARGSQGRDSTKHRTECEKRLNDRELKKVWHEKASERLETLPEGIKDLLKEKFKCRKCSTLT